MVLRPLLLMGGLAAAAAVPYVALDDGLSKAARESWQRLVAPAAEKQPGDLLAQVKSVADQAALAAAPKTPAGPPVAIEEAFRFDVTPAWVTSRWPRVSTVSGINASGEAKHLGMRVPLVSGTQLHDVAGSLTYYFNEHHELDRITFSGLTGDPRRVLAAIVGPFQLQSQPTIHAAHYTAGDPKQPTSQVTVKHLPVVSAAARVRAEVQVDLRRAGTSGALSQSAPRATSAPPTSTPRSEPSLLPTSYRRW